MSHYESARLCQNDVVASHSESSALVVPASGPMILVGLTDALQGVAIRRWQFPKVHIESHVASALWYFYNLGKCLGGRSNRRWCGCVRRLATLGRIALAMITFAALFIVNLHAIDFST